MEYLFYNRTAEWNHYKRMFGSSIRCISFSCFLSITFKKDQGFLCIMSQSQLLSNNGESTRKSLKISVPHFDNSELIKSFSKTLIRCMNPEEHDMKALITNIPKIWKLEDRVAGTDLGLGKFQFAFEREEFRTAPTYESIGDAIGRTVAVDVEHACVQVVVDAFKELCFETTIDFKGGEFY